MRRNSEFTVLCKESLRKELQLRELPPPPPPPSAPPPSAPPTTLSLPQGNSRLVENLNEDEDSSGLKMSSKATAGVREEKERRTA
ncbi:hypothetical protein M0802_005274 [Mischocyttarus mexicanus]|nr:hypothetical protein M0802_005274 [Mischocyttarus mexicanus]